MSVRTLSDNFNISAIPEIALSKRSTKEGENAVWHLTNFEESIVTDLDEVTESAEALKVMRSFFEYIVGEWAKNQWGSSWSGEHWGTSWGPNVVLVGKNSANLKEVLLRIQLDRNTDKYLIGQYKKAIQANQGSIGELTVGLVNCTTKSGPQCQISKGQSISPKLKLKILSH